MRTVTMHEARTHLSRRFEQAARGETVIIAKAGKPLVEVTPLDADDTAAPRRLGVLDGAFAVPKDFDTIGREDVERPFGSGT